MKKLASILCDTVENSALILPVLFGGLTFVSIIALCGL